MGNAATAVQPVEGLRPVHGLWAAARSLIITAALLLTVLYGSLIPFRFSRDRLSLGFLNDNLLRLHTTTLEDIVVNVTLYAVVAACMMLMSARKGAAQALFTVSVCAALSFAAEAMQALLPHRVSSATDFFLNVFGATLGVLLARTLSNAQQSVVRRFSQNFQLQPLTALVVALSCALMTYQLVPFDFITGTDQLHEAFGRLRPGNRLQVGIADIVSELPFAGWFAIIGFLLARDLMLQGKSPLRALGTGLGHGFLLSVLIESLQLFTQSHVPEVLPALIRSVAAVFGAWTAVFILGETAPDRRVTAHFRISLPILLLAAAMEFVVLGIGLIPQRMDLTGSAVSQFKLPFQAHWLAPTHVACAKAVSAIVTSGLLAATLAAVMRRTRVPCFRMATTLLVIGFHLLFQLPAFTGRTQAIDLTNTLLALLACGIALRLERWAAQLEAYACVPAGR